MKKLLLTFVLVALLNAAFAQTNTAWSWFSTSGVASNAPGRQLADMTTDANGNVYAIGRFMGTLTIGGLSVSTSGDGTSNANYDEDAFVVKYNSAGVAQWLKRLGKVGTANNEWASVIAVDANGNAYVGITNGGVSIGGLNFLTKFDTNGNQLWSACDYSISGITVRGNAVWVTGNNQIKKFDLDGNEQWTVANAGAGAADNFVDTDGNAYLTTYALGSSSGTFLGQNFTAIGLATTYIGKINSNGAVQWIQEIKGRSASYYTVDKNGRSYIWLVGGFGDVFQGISTNNISGFSYFELDNTGSVARYLKNTPYKGAFKVRDDGIYGYSLEVGNPTARAIAYGDYFINMPTDPTVAIGIAIKYNKATDAVDKIATLEMKGGSYNPGQVLVAQYAQNSKMMIGGWYGSSLKLNNSTYAVSASSGSTPSDFFLAQCDLSLVPAPEVTNWTGQANDGNWDNAANWSNGIPNGTKKTVLPSGLTSYPTTIPANAAPAKLEVASGAKVQLPLNFSAPFGIVNNGTIEINTAGTFTGAFNNVVPSGTGKVTIKNAGVTFYFTSAFNQTLELNFSGTATTYGGTINGDLILTNGSLNLSFELYPLVVNNIVGGSETSHIIGKVASKVAANGNYNFPIGTSDRYAPVSLQLNNVTGPTTIAASFTKTINGSAPNVAVGGKQVSSLLNTGIWTVTPDVALTAGSYTISLTGKGYTNGAADVRNYVVLKRNNSSSAWGFFGENGTSTESNGQVTAQAGKINGFSDFAIGIANGAVPSTLPVKLIDFQLKASLSSVILTWKTATELNNEKFLVERSDNGIDFEQIATLKGNGTTNQLSNYSYADLKPLAGYNYYRLKQIDLNGDIEISEVKMIKFDLNVSTEISIFPNPVSDFFNVSYSGGPSKLAQLFDFSGKKLVDIVPIANQFSIPSNLNNGLYLVKIIYQDQRVSQHKLIIKR